MDLNDALKAFERKGRPTFEECQLPAEEEDASVPNKRPCAGIEDFKRKPILACFHEFKIK